jgi:hypothetical protein
MSASGGPYQRTLSEASSHVDQMISAFEQISASQPEALLPDRGTPAPPVLGIRWYGHAC